MSCMYGLKIFIKILWHVDSLLGNDLEISSYKTAVDKQWLCKQQSLLGNGRNRFVTRNNGVTGKRCFLHGPCDCEKCFLCDT
jgi:hypothetical protein